MRNFFKLFPAGLVGYLLCVLPASADQMYVASYGTYIDKVDGQGQSTPFASTPLFYAPDSMAADSSGHLYVSIGQGNQIYKYDTSGQGTLFASAGLNNPGFLTFSPSGQLYAINRSDHNIVRFDAEGNPTVFANTGIYQPSYLAFDSSGNLYTTIGSTTVLKYDAQGNGSEFASINSPYGLAYYGGNLYVSTAAESILRVDGLGNISPFAVTPGAGDSFGMVFDSGGTLYTIDGFNTITRIDQAGNASPFATLDSKNLYGIAIVPEPAEGVLLIFGLSVFVGKCLRKRKLPTF
jgi:hypothetical protein